MRVCVNSVKRQTLQVYVICQQFVFVGRNWRGKYLWSNSLVTKLQRFAHLSLIPCQHIVHLPTHPPTSTPLTLQLNTTVYLTTFNHICKSSVVYAMTTILVFLNKEIFITLWKHNLKALFKTPLKLGSCRKNINDIVIVC